MPTPKPALTIFIVAFSLIFPAVSYCKGIQTSISKSEKARWSVSYRASKPINRIAFSRNPDNSRAARWQPTDSAYEIVVVEQKEFVVRKDGDKFREVTFNLTPTYRHLHQFHEDYGPFSPFSDGGMSIHSGRFFACEDKCSDDSDEWPFTLSIPPIDQAIVHGEIVSSGHEWQASGDGSNIYIGEQQPIFANGFVVLIDAGLPAKLRASLLTDIPKLTAFFETRLGKITPQIRPSLFASYSNTKGKDIQGGVLPNQIFIHWDKNDLEKQSNDDDFISGVLWTFAHEVAHYYQQFKRHKREVEESWIHEGHAEFLAYDALSELYPSSSKYMQSKVASFRNHCATSLKRSSLTDSATSGDFKAYYTCGFLIHQLISTSSQNQLAPTPYSVWRLFLETSQQEDLSNSTAYLMAVADLNNKILSEKIKSFIEKKHENPKFSVNEIFNLDGGHQLP